MAIICYNLLLTTVLSYPLVLFPSLSLSLYMSPPPLLRTAVFQRSGLVPLDQFPVVHVVLPLNRLNLSDAARFWSVSTSMKLGTAEKGNRPWYGATMNMVVGPIMA